MPERMIEVGGVELCSDCFGDPGDPPILLVMGMSASMICWEDDFCRLLAGGGRFVIRYDHRDTGRSTAYEPGHPGYAFEDLVADAAGVIDAYGVGAAHVAGVSMGGAIAQLLALDHAGHVRSLSLLMTSPGGPGLPPPSEAFAEFFRAPEPDAADREALVDYVVAVHRLYAGQRRPFDEARVRSLAVRDVQRTRNPASAGNHALAPGERSWRDELPSIAVPTLVILGTADPLFAPAHGEALANEIPGAELVVIEGAGHTIQPADWDTIASAILAHTGRRA